MPAFHRLCFRRRCYRAAQARSAHGLPGIITSALAQTTGLMPGIQAMLGFIKETGLSYKLAEAKSQEVADIRRSIDAPASVGSDNVLRSPRSWSVHGLPVSPESRRAA